MTFQVVFKVEANPVGKGRPKFARRGNFVSTYTPKKTTDYEEIIKKAAKNAMGSSEPLETPVSCYFYISLPVPASYSKKRREACLTNSERPTKKPDIDNIVKCFLDALNGVIYQDDTQVVSIHATKVYGSIGMVDVLVREELI